MPSIHHGDTRMQRLTELFLIIGLVFGGLSSEAQRPTVSRPSLAENAPPILPREFRAAWVATVKNIDWPSRPGLPVAQQQAELKAILDQALRLNLNALLFQVRPACDAFYDSAFEPWSEYLTGLQGQPPEPFWDPLRFATEHAHARGLELHAWFNPFRVRLNAKQPGAASHISRRSPQLVQTVGTDLWLDPGESDARDHTIKVILDVVQRYDIDGVHLDDYFYPYPFAGIKVEFPDDRSWQRYRRAGGRFSRDDWRRDNVNTFVRQLSDVVHREKPWLRFGISPFGIWRPGNPAPIRGMDAHNVLYGDSRRWLQEGWVDYLSPQLYWPISPREQSFPLLLNWWVEQSTQKIPIWPGLASARIGEDRNAQEIFNQIRLTRKQPSPTGMLFWNYSSLGNNQGGIANLLTNTVFHQPALVPGIQNKAANSPESPELSFELLATLSRLRISWTPETNTPARRFVLQSRFGNYWRTEFFGANQRERVYFSSPSIGLPEEVLLMAVGSGGLSSKPARWSRTVPAALKVSPTIQPKLKSPASKPIVIVPKSIRSTASTNNAPSVKVNSTKRPQ